MSSAENPEPQDEGVTTTKSTLPPGSKSSSSLPPAVESQPRSDAHSEGEREASEAAKVLPSHSDIQIEERPRHEDLATASPRSEEKQVQQMIVPNSAQLMVTPLEQLTTKPAQIDCPYCHRCTMTSVTAEGTSMQAVVGVLLCLICVCAACLPCACGWFENHHVYCSSCRKKVAIISDDGFVQVIRPVEQR
ncbi:hypothetical protein M406DRAFT_355925 [Cryphonectria parasitica EP155]|uniref:LITAF domain-containing protein n=1 Tax=Cryphonectria parasitica (strain ATCC 38755 / EP155) TaxID=660469 RepID=A0A9P4Y3I3_CRYP1|nr:uncharacterized protein M406DRAFT_355925 [Cryphonectria parasitica EP155]KAF3765465.1 hypothetical protein M406DRAFT_355925 [Cryphonectria parasitica EP155]